MEFAHIVDSRRDVAYALRMLLRSPGFSTSMIAILAIGIGANTAVFSLVNAVVLKPLRAPEEDRMVQFRVIYPNLSSSIASPRQFNLWQAESGVFQEVSAHWLDHLNLESGSMRELIPAARVTADFFRLYGAPVLYGRTFNRAEDRPQAGHVVVLSHRLWSARLGADPAVIGRSVLLGGAPFVVVGVLGPSFDTEQFDEAPDVWLPFQIDEHTAGNDGRLCFVTGRLTPGVTLEAAQARLQLAAERYARSFPQRGVKTSFTVLPLREGMTSDIRTSLWLLIASVGLVLLLTCSNLASLLLVRAESRRREVVIRAALGAGKWRLLRQFLTENLLLSSAGGMCGLFMGTAGIQALIRLAPVSPLGLPMGTNSIPRIGEAGLPVLPDWHVAGFTVLCP